MSHNIENDFRIRGSFFFCIHVPAHWLNAGEDINRRMEQSRLARASHRVSKVDTALPSSIRLYWAMPTFNQHANAITSPQAGALSMNLFEQHIAEIKISYSHKVKPSNQIRITGSRAVYDYVYPLWPDLEYRERFAVLLLSRGLKILGLSWISTGGVSGTVVDAKLIFQVALKANASSVILLHNHPSGELRTSDADRLITRKIKDGAKLLDIDIPDHIIITSESYYSMADEGQL